jgi:CRISPR-associated endonuclease/helicase Cas3
MRWQIRLFGRVLAGNVPAVCDLPTGLGKTSVIPIWLIALASQSHDSGKSPLPRRLVYIVNRRTVVDQATEVVEAMRLRLLDPQEARWTGQQETLVALKRALQALFAHGEGEVLGVSTLRGELADNEEWKADPARPAIAVGTIDMIGSKLLFSGYGDGRYLRAHHAGLIGQDTLIVHDEAHLTPAFGDLLVTIAREQRREVERRGYGEALGRPIRVIQLSATSRAGNDDTFALKPEDQKDSIVEDRLTAVKRLYLRPVPENVLVEEIVARSTKHEEKAAKVLIYVRSPEQAQQVASALDNKLGTSARERIGLLTGTVRGHERDQLMQQPPVSAAARVIRHFLEGTQPGRTVYLVSTAAGEVGIDLDADHMVSDLTTLDAMIQRLGRVNRRGGGGRRARVDVVGDAQINNEPSELDKALRTTFELLKRWGGERDGGVDVSPGSMRGLVGNLSASEREAAFSPKAEVPHLTDILLDAWSLTSVDEMSGRAEVAAFLHGVTRDPPETFVVWRREIDLLAGADVDESALRDWFRSCRVEAQERLRDQTERVRGGLARLLRNHGKASPDMDFRVALLDERSGTRWSRLSRVVEKSFPLAFRTLVLPVGAGGLDMRGMVDAKATEPPEGVFLDVAEARTGLDRRERWLCRRSADTERYERLATGELLDRAPAALREKARVALKQVDQGEDTPESLELVLFVSPPRSALDDPETTSARQTLEEHSRAIAERMATIAERLWLPEPIRDALVTAARWHDNGKDRTMWQRYARNDDGSQVLAKSRRYLHPSALGGYRHEYGSLLDAISDAGIQQHPERELVLHLIAAHHGWARPHFEPRAYDHERFSTRANDAAAVDVVRRFERLQRRFGRWGLAHLESVMRCADIAASKVAAETTGPGPERRGIPA